MRVLVASPGFSTRHRDIVSGIHEWASRHTDWDLLFDFGISSRESEIGLLATTLGADAVVCHAPHDQADPLLRKIPFVSTMLARWPCEWPVVTVDDVAVGRMAAEHLIERGLRHFAVLTSEGEPFNRRRNGFCARVAEEGLACQFISIDGSLRGMEVDRQLPQLLDWIVQLPRPCGLLIWRDSRAIRIIHAIQSRGLAVPDDVAVIGVNNDELACRLTGVPLTSVDVNGKEIGRQAARLLDQMLSGRPTPSEVLVPPRGVVARQSTDLRLVADDDVARAVQYIRDNLHRPTGVADLLREVPVGRRVLERKFRTVLGRSPYDEIRRAKVERAKQLLAESEMKIDEVARAVGFRRRAHLTAAMSQFAGETPGRYRRSHGAKP